MSFKKIVSVDLKPLEEAVRKWKSVPEKMLGVKTDFDTEIRKSLTESDWRGEAANAAKGRFKAAAREMEAASREARYVHGFLRTAYKDLHSAQKRLNACVREIGEDKYLKIDGATGEVSLDEDKLKGLPAGQQQMLSKGYFETVNGYNRRVTRAIEDARRADNTLKWALEFDVNGRYAGFTQVGNPPLLPSDRRPYGKEKPNGTDNKTWWKANALILSGLAYQGHGNAYDLLSHYLENSGKDYKVDPATMLQSLPRFRGKLGEDLKRYKGDSSFDTGWKSTRANEKDSLDWYYALNGFQYRVKGRKVYDASGKERMVAELSVYKRYNWGNGSESVPRKDLHKGPIELKQKDMAHLHTSGKAREYNVVGKTNFVIDNWPKR
ncbi:hypothetical protein [Streptomyces iconiensis]|uniref:Uncharacterized protein n=1 Tax=Streptomyces iconiensis TaxID=1384038 RepID=A0ABT6ZW07_9ACTN|nr:hypothetical protein [Streptomyces iconiensis]MDJ1133251.1 hypothetical protein [Streptomyces iconiensis]